MICDECGREFHGSEATQDYRFDRCGDQNNWKVPMMICPACAEGRGKTLMWYVYFFVVLLAGGLIVGVLTQAF
jgi:hypothetical protein